MSTDQPAIQDVEAAARLTVTALAEHLGVAHRSLYRHVENRDGLVELGVERLVVASNPMRSTPHP